MYEIRKDRLFYSSLKILKNGYGIPKSMKRPQLYWFLFIFLLQRLISLMAFVILPGLHVIITLRDKTGVDISEDLSTIFGTFGTNVISVCFLLQYNKWSQFLVELETCKKFGIPEDFETLIKKMNLYSVLCGLYSVIGVTIYAMIASTKTSHCRKFNEEHGLNELCGTFTPIWLPFDGNPIFIRSTVFALQMFMGIITLGMPSVICFFVYEEVEILVSYMRLLKQRFTQVFETTSPAERRNRLRLCVYFHADLLSLCEDLSTLGKYSTGFLSLVCAIVCGSIGNLIIKSHSVAAVCYFLGYASALLILCHAGQKLMDETLTIGDALYDSRWYDGDVEIMKDVCFILARCQRPATLGSLPIGVMNYSLFLLIMKTSYSYLTLLNQNT